MHPLTLTDREVETLILALKYWRYHRRGETRRYDRLLTRDALAKGGNRSVVYKLYPELNHLFAVSKTGSVADYYDPMAEVDRVFAELTSAGYESHLAPWDAFWGQRYAVVVDPDGHHVDLFAAK